MNARLLVGLLAVANWMASAAAQSLPPVPAAELSASFGVSSPEAAGIDSGKLIELTQWIVQGKKPIFSVLISRDGKLVYELYTSSLSRDEAHYQMSVTKSVTSALVGAAIDRRLIPNADATIAKALPRSLFASEADVLRFGNLTIKEVLGMSALDALVPPFDKGPEATARAQQMNQAQNRVAFALTQSLLPTPGTSFQYNDVTPYLAAGIVQYNTGKSLLDFAEEAIFRPLNFHNEEWMHQDPAGIDNAGYGLRLRPIDMQKFGILFLRGGKWNGKQILSEDWVKNSLQPWIRDKPNVRRPDYGWFWWWRSYGAGWSSSEARGWKGQFIAVIPEQKMVVTMTAYFNDDSENTVFIEMMQNFIVPATAPGPKSAADRTVANKLATALADARKAQLMPSDPEARMVPSKTAKGSHRKFVPSKDKPPLARK